MPRVRRSPQVEDYLVRMDWRDAESDLAGWCDELAASYEAGKVVLLANAPLRIDYELLNRVTLPVGRRFKKTKDRFFLYPRLHQRGVPALFWRAFGGDLGLYLAFRREVRSVSEQIRAFAQKAFPGYRFLGDDVSWRFSATGPEDLHIDSFGSNEDMHYLRIFVNVDEQPRLWNVSHRLDELGERYYESAELGALRDASGNEFCHAVNLAAFGGAEGPGLDGHPRHEVEFEQGDVWLCDSRIVSHQIVSGRRLVVTHFEVAPDSMRDPEQRVDARVTRCHERHAPRPAA